MATGIITSYRGEALAKRIAFVREWNPRWSVQKIQDFMDKPADGAVCALYGGNMSHPIQTG